MRARGHEGARARSTPPHVLCRLIHAESIWSSCNSCQAEHRCLHHVLVSSPVLPPNEVRVTAAIPHARCFAEQSTTPAPPNSSPFSV